MRIVYFSDIHGNQYSFNAFLKSIEDVSADMMIFGGDIFGYYYGAKEILSVLMNGNFTCLLGNHDQMFLDLIDGKIDREYLISRYGNSYKDIDNRINASQVDFLRSLGSRYDLKVDGKHLVFVHGTVEDPLNGRMYPDADIEKSDIYEGIDYVFSGHTHHKMEKTFGSTKIINGGSLGQQRDGKGCSYLLYDSIKDSVEIRVVEYNIEELEQEILIKDEGDMCKKLLEVLRRVK